MTKTALLTIAILLLTGCYAPLPKPTPEPTDGHSDEAVIEPREGVSVSVALPVGAWDWVATNLKGNTLTIRDAITIKDPSGVAVTIAAGTEATIEVASDQALVTFSKPFPNAKKMGVNADIKSLVLKPDGTGTAQTAKFGSWSFRWIDDGSKSAPGCVCGCSRADCTCSTDAVQTASNAPKDPQTHPKTRHAIYWTASWCGPCRTFGPRLKALADKHKLNIRTIDVDQNPTAWQPFAARDNQIPQVVFYDGDTFLESIVQPTDEQILKAMGVK